MFVRGSVLDGLVGGRYCLGWWEGLYWMCGGRFYTWWVGL